MGARCAGCGDCCRLIGIKSRIEDLRHTFFNVLRGNEDVLHPDGTAEATGRVLYERAFILNHWSPVTHDEGMAIDPLVVESSERDGRTLYVCDAYEPETRTCRVHDRNPAVCSGFPWYGGQPNDYALLAFPRCSFWHDVPRDQWPEGIDPLPSPDPVPENCC